MVLFECIIEALPLILFFGFMGGIGLYLSHINKTDRKQKEGD